MVVGSVSGAMATISRRGIRYPFQDSTVCLGSFPVATVCQLEKHTSSGLRGSGELWCSGDAGMKGTTWRRYVAADGWEKEFWFGSECDAEDKEILLNDGSHSSEWSPSSDWAARARERALQSLQSRDPSFKALPSSRSKKLKRSRFTKENNQLVSGKRHVGSICWPVEEEIWSVSQSDCQQLSGKHDAERSLNKKLIQAEDCQQILAIISGIQQSRELQLLTPINAATALHRIARQMERASMPSSERLAFARQQEMRQLVSLITSRIRSSDAQGVSNIAWALSKIGGTHMYGDEMIMIGAAAMRVFEQLQPQHIANIAGAYASMRLANPGLFERLALRVSMVAKELRPQEMAQVLWAYASLFHSASPLLDALDQMCEDLVPSKSEMPAQHVGNECHAVKQLADMFDDWSLEHLAVMAWSYSVLRELHRPVFAKIWERLRKADYSQYLLNKCLKSSRFLSQLYQVKLTADLEYPGLLMPSTRSLEEATAGFWNKQKQHLLSTSTLQREIQQIVVGTGFQFVPEYTTAYYSVDFALLEKKIALEVDGPSHFTRNTGTPLGHTILKARHLGAAGWKVVSVPYHELEKLEGERNHLTYIRKLIQGCMIAVCVAWELVASFVPGCVDVVN